jgi:hypothetical protein
MKFAPMLGRHLKDDEVVEVLEAFDMSVIYDFDRLHENADDVYWSGSKDDGFLFRFDHNQVLNVVFLYVMPRSGYSPVNTRVLDVQIYDSLEQASLACVTKGIPHRQQDGLADNPDHAWIKLDFGNHTVHYEFLGRKLSLITLEHTPSPE